MSSKSKWTQANRAAADQPAQSISDDLLGRGPFAKSLAKAILNWKEPESLVVSLTGPWGSGKSSVVNFIVETIQKEPREAQPDILRFNPWQSAERLDSSERLLREISITLKQDHNSIENQRIAKKWQQWAAAVRLSTATFEAYSKLPSVLLATGFLGLVASLAIKYPFVETIFSIMSVVTLTVGLFLQSSATIAEKAAAFFSARAVASERTLDELRTELRSAMASRRRQLVVVVDDIDRLPQVEVQSLFRTIRANADFPNLVFLLVFERTVVEKALADQAHVDGSEYLKKIIQVPFSIPKSDPGKVQSVLLTALDDALDSIPNTVPFNKGRWANIFSGGVSHYFPTLRDVYRYMTTFVFHLGIFRSTRTMEVNQIDLIALETLRVFEPRIYEALPRFRDLLMDGPGRFRSTHRDREALAASELDKLLSLAQKPENHPAIKKILAGVFQPFEWLLKNYSYASSFHAEWERELRACSETHFDRYFHLYLQENEVSQALIELILEAASDRERLVAELQQLRERGLLEAMLNRLEAHKETVDLQAAIPFVTAVFDIGDDIVSKPGLSIISAEMHALRIVYHYLARIPTYVEREQVFLTAVNATTGIRLPVDLVRMDARDKDRSDHEYIFSEARLPDLQALCVEKIRTASEDGRLMHHSEIATLMDCWLTWTDGTVVRTWAKSVASSSVGALALVRGFIRSSYTYNTGTNSTHTRRRIEIEWLVKFVPVEILEESIGKASKEALSVEDSEIVALFVQALGDWHEKLKKAE